MVTGHLILSDSSVFGSAVKAVIQYLQTIILTYQLPFFHWGEGAQVALLHGHVGRDLGANGLLSRLFNQIFFSMLY